MVMEAKFPKVILLTKNLNQHCYTTKRTYKTPCAEDMYAEHLFCTHLFLIRKKNLIFWKNENS